MSARSPTWNGPAAAIVTLTCLVLGGCTSGSISARVINTSSAPKTSMAPPTTTTLEQPGWTPVSTVGTTIAVDSQSVIERTGHVVTIFRFRAGHTHFGLHVGRIDPPLGTASVGTNNGPTIGPNEAPVLLAAFNGGFEASSGAGNLLYAASMNAVPVDLANALISAGALTGMELDINPEWVQLASATAPGGTLAPGVPGQNRPGDQYQIGWSR